MKHRAAAVKQDILGIVPGPSAVQVAEVVVEPARGASVNRQGGATHDARPAQSALVATQPTRSTTYTYISYIYLLYILYIYISDLIYNISYNI